MPSMALVAGFMAGMKGIGAAPPGMTEAQSLTEHLLTLYPKLTQAQAAWNAQQLITGQSTRTVSQAIQQQLTDARNLEQAVTRLTNATRVHLTVEQLMNRALFEGNATLAGRVGAVAQNVAGLMQQLGLRREYAASMAIYEAAVAAEDAADLDFWDAAEADLSSALYAKAAMTSTPSGGGASGGGGGSAATKYGSRNIGAPGSGSGAGGSSPGTSPGHGSGVNTFVNMNFGAIPPTAGAMQQLITGVNVASGNGTVHLVSSGTSGIPAPEY